MQNAMPTSRFRMPRFGQYGGSVSKYGQQIHCEKRGQEIEAAICAQFVADSEKVKKHKQ